MTIKSKKDFYNLSKKMWLEFYLQMFKSHTLDMCVSLAIVDDWPKYASLESSYTSSLESYLYAIYSSLI